MSKKPQFVGDLSPGEIDAKLRERYGVSPPPAPVAQDMAQPSPKTELLAECGNILSELHKILVERGRNYADIRTNSDIFTQLMEGMGMVYPEGWAPVHSHCISNISTKLARAGSGAHNHEDTWLDIANYSILLLAAIRLSKRA